MRVRDVVCGLMLGLVLCSADASAQSSPQSPPQDWQFRFTPYLWGSGVDGQVGVGARTADVDASFRNILDHLHIAAMGFGTAEHGRFVAMTDAFYTDVRGQRATPGPLFSSVSPQQSLFMLTPAAGYRVHETPNGSVDVLGGVRLFRTRTQLEFQTGLLPGVNVEGSRTWVDAIAGVSARRSLSDKWWAAAYGDLGGGGSDFTYQIVANAGFDFSDRYALTLGYRHLGVDYDASDFLMDATLNGPVVGFMITLPRLP